MSTYIPPISVVDSTNLEHATNLSIDQLCRVCAVHSNYILDLVQESIIVPSTPVNNNDVPEIAYAWRFTGLHVHHAKVESRLQRNLVLT